MLAENEGGEAHSNVLQEQLEDKNGEMPKRTKRIAVIGAGFSGLTAAAELKRLGEPTVENSSSKE